MPPLLVSRLTTTAIGLAPLDGINDRSPVKVSASTLSRLIAWRSRIGALEPIQPEQVIVAVSVAWLTAEDFRHEARILRLCQDKPPRSAP